ncbi:efflux RND transporter periplasmic adaptor subunit [Pandoraea sp.]|uniref:efflux RND transporter periplasmic adaptor subunit n=1 Tax=Pandoraea sp. TaxID=1883445 RepID=UPI001207DE1C|nr:efflux RND transporter periplasmic adaptor subunit [Pandoraea sp.]TAL55280.1 MAG: efflux RND transporter periplasmic adaptor subunit [Pandoraea sp.]TAM18198.1 MAG: efflux RND transporter periplasmic adaptor subunit [Pandoraea sp.]
MRRRRIASSVICLLPLALTACGNKHISDPRTETSVVGAALVTAAPTVSLSFTGVVGARVVSDQGFRVSGKLLQRLVDTGQTVKRGQVLMRIDPIDLRLDAHALSESVAAARARAKQTAHDEARYRGLVAAGAVSASAYDQIKAAADSAQAQLAAVEAQADVAKNAANYAVLRADADGVVVDTRAEPGQVVSAGQVVVRLAHAGPREAIVDLPETLRPIIGSTADATLYGRDRLTVPARLRQLSDAADPLTRTYEARYVLTGALAKAPLGATVTIRIPEHQNAVQADMQVPIGAVFDPGHGPGVWTITGHPAHVAWRPVKVLGLTDGTARIESTAGGLKIGDQVVALGAQLLHNGEEIRPIPLTTNTSAIVERGGLLQ